MAYGVISTIAGTGAPGVASGAGSATATPLTTPVDIAATPDGGFLVANQIGQQIERVNRAGVIATVAGTFIKCLRTSEGIACYVAKSGGGPAPSSYAATISDTKVEAGRVGAAKAGYTSPKQPKATTWMERSRSVRCDGPPAPTPPRRSRTPATIDARMSGRARHMLMIPPAATAPAPM